MFWSRSKQPWNRPQRRTPVFVVAGAERFAHIRLFHRDLAPVGERNKRERHGRSIALTGCMAVEHGEALLDRLPELDYVFDVREPDGFLAKLLTARTPATSGCPRFRWTPCTPSPRPRTCGPGAPR